MKKSDKTPKQTHRRADPNVMGLHADVVEQNITETLETNYMPYAMSVICLLYTSPSPRDA